MIIVGMRHHDDCHCGCARVAGLTGWLVQDSDTPKLASMDDPMLIAEFEVPSPAGGKSRLEQVAYSYAELGWRVLPPKPSGNHEAQHLFQAPQTIRGQMTL